MILLLVYKLIAIWKILRMINLVLNVFFQELEVDPASHALL